MLLVGHSARGAIITEARNNMTFLGWCMSRRFAPNDGETLAGMANSYRATTFCRDFPIDGGFSFVAFETSGEDSAQDLSPVRMRRVFLYRDGVHAQEHNTLTPLHTGKRNFWFTDKPLTVRAPASTLSPKLKLQPRHRIPWIRAGECRTFAGCRYRPATKLSRRNAFGRLEMAEKSMAGW